MKVIETHYNGFRVRSRLEARWAVFLAALGIQYEYETEGYVLNRLPCLSDFLLRLARQPFYVEVNALETSLLFSKPPGFGLAVQRAKQARFERGEVG